MSSTINIPMPPFDPKLGFSDADCDLEITARFPLSEAQWAYLLSVLEAMKDGLVEDPKQPWSLGQVAP